jgi:hypothetical protein
MSSNFNLTGPAAGVSGQIIYNGTTATGFGSSNTAIGVQGTINNQSTGTIGTCAAVQGSCGNLVTGGSITNFSCLLADTGGNGSTTAGSIGTWYGLKVNAPPTNVGTAYAVYTIGTKRYLGVSAGAKELQYVHQLLIGHTCKYERQRRE